MNAEKLIVEGPARLTGKVHVSCAKNAYLPILAATLLSTKKVELCNVPKLKDIDAMLAALQSLGVLITANGDNWTLNTSLIESHEPVSVEKAQTRGMILLLGPLLGRLGEAKLPLPGGCPIGQRPIDIHVSALEELGARVTIRDGYIYAKAERLVGTQCKLHFPSVGATENVMMAAVLAEGKTVIENAAKEPEVTDLANFLIAMGVRISGAGTSVLTIDGVQELQEVKYKAVSDRIEAATYIMAALATKSSIEVVGICPDYLDCVLQTLRRMGANVHCTEDSIVVNPSELNPLAVETAPFPGFPTDLQPQLMALLTQVEGISVVKENLFEDRFQHVPELKKFGAAVTVHRNLAFIHGGTQLTGACVRCTDLRAAAALLISALASKGRSEICNISQLDRGYESLEKKLKSLGVKVQRVSMPSTCGSTGSRALIPLPGACTLSLSFVLILCGVLLGYHNLCSIFAA